MSSRMKTYMEWLGVSFGIVALLSGCAPLSKSDCDPSVERDALTKSRCLWVGKQYDQRAQDLQLTLEEQKKINADLKASLQALQKQKDQISSELQKETQDYTALNNQVNAVLANLKAKSAQNAKLRQSIQSIEAQLAKVDQTKDSPSTLEKRAELDELKRRLTELQAQVGG